MTDPRFDLDELLGDALPRRARPPSAGTRAPRRGGTTARALTDARGDARAAVGADPRSSPARYRYSTVIAAAVAAVTLFGAGYFIGGGTGPSPSQQTVDDERPG